MSRVRAQLSITAVLAGVLAACTPARSTPGYEPVQRVEILREVQLTQNARIPANDGHLIDVEVYPDRLVFIYSAAPKIPLEVDHVVSGLEGGGYLRRLTAVRALSETRIEADTVAAELGELIGDGHFIVHLRPRDDSFEATSEVGRTVAPLDSGWSIFTPEIRGSGVTCGGGSTTGVDIDPRFDIDFDADLEIDMRWSWEWLIPRGELHYARLELMGSFSPGVTIDTTDSGSVSCSWSPELPDYEWVTPIPVGPIIIPITHTIAPSFSISVGGSVQTGASTMSADATVGFRAGAEYTRGPGWSPIWDPTRTGSASLTASEEGTLSVMATASAGIGYTCKLFDTVGPGVELSPRMGGTFTVNDRCSWEAEATAGVDLSGLVELSIPVFDYRLAEYRVTGALVDATIAETSGTFPWCQDAGMPDGGMPGGDGGTTGTDGGTGSDGGSSDPCTSLGSTCQTCNDNPGCGFCRTTGQCMSDARAGECGTALEWQDGPSECEVCDGLGACGDCVNNAFCGWCASTGTCMTAESGGAPPVACADWQYSITADMCR